MTYRKGGSATGVAVAFLAVLAALAPAALRAHPVQWTHLSSAYGDLPVPPSSNGQAGLRVIDLDRDGDTDYLITLWDASSIVWYRQVAGTFAPYIIEPLSYNLTHGERFADIDGDGDIDLIFGQMRLGNDIYWWENPYPNYHPSTRWTRRLVRDSGGNFYHDNIWGDFDGDGADEFISWNQGGEQLLFFEIPGDPKTSGAWPATPIYTWSSAGGLTYRGIDAADMNLDGKIDMIGGGGWFEHTGGTGFVFHQIDPLMGTARQVVGQVIPGGRPEVVAVQELADGPVNLYEWTGSTWSVRTLLTEVPRSHTLQIGDIDGDGHLDILHGEMGPLDYVEASADLNPVLRMLYGDGAGHFTEQIIHVGQGTLEGKLADIDGDGDLDIIGNTFRHNAPRMDMWINEGGSSQGAIVSDDFSGGALNAGLWTVVDPVGGGSASVSAKALELDVPGGVDHDLWTEGNRSVRVMQAAPDADFEMEVKFESAVAQAFQLQGLVVEEDGGNYLRFNVQSEGTAGVVRLFAASVADGVPSARVSLNVASGATYYLRVGRAGDRWTFRHCYDGEAWTTAGTFDCVLAVGAVGVFAGNASGSASPAFTAVADYFFNTASPIEPEDGEPANAPPSVDAGPDRSLELPDAAILDGTVSDDGLPDPPGAVSVTWSVASGPAAVAFGDATAVDTTATFSSAGTYVLRLTASDGALSASDTMTVVVEDPPSLPENGRIAEGLIVFYAFDEGEGTIIHDISGVGETLDLSIADPSAVSWGTGTLAVNAPAGIISTGTAEKIHGAVTATNEITIEAWIAPANVVQDGPSRIVTMSEGPYSRNFTLGQGLWEGQAADVFDVRLRTTGTDANGQPSTTTASGTVQPALHHVAYSRDASGEVRLYVDGVTRILSQVGGTLSNWDPGYHLGLADEVGGGRPWSGTYHLLAIYDRALTEAEVARNLDEGPDAPPWGGETPTFVRGDPNADGAVDLGDAVFILQYIFGGPSPACRASLDIDADGVIDIGDAIRLLNYIFLGGPSPAPPFPGPPAPCP